MSHHSPLTSLHQEYVSMLREWAKQQVESGAITAEVSFEPQVEYIHADLEDAESEEAREILATYGPVESEYAAIRRGAGMMDRSNRVVISVTGNDRQDFLNRMLTQELKDLKKGSVKQSFWLNRKGRIEADLLLMETGDRLLMDVDFNQAGQVVESLNSFIFSEEVQLTDCSADIYRISLHGSLAIDAICKASETDCSDLEQLNAVSVEIEGVETTVARCDQTGEVGLELFVPHKDAAKVWKKILSTDDELSGGKRRIRPIGWYAYNIARIEAGTPLMNVDFGTTNLPHESGIVEKRISFTKGCYLGQEIVARMQSLGKPKQQVVGIKIQGDLLPVAGAQIFEKTDEGFGNQIGVVTSSTISPMLGAVPIAFGMINSKFTELGTRVIINAEGQQVSAEVCNLKFWPENK